MSDTTEISKHEFKAEVRQLLDILARSLYTNREIFLRELISNASDALEKLRFEMNRGTKVANPELDLEIRISFDTDRKVLTLKDTGIGMSREELIEDIGTIARSGSSAFLEAASENDTKLESIIGKFGVGFYSVFMVADEVIVTSRSYLADAPPTEWRSDGAGTFEIGPAKDSNIPRGTTVEVHLRDDAKEFIELFRVKDAIRKHSSFISFPIIVDKEQVNTIPALWREPKFSIQDEKYNEFYKFLTHDIDAPFDKLHITVDAPVQFNALLFIPENPLELLGYKQDRPGIDLYIRRVLIQKGNKELIPEYLGFVRGVIDSEDLPLNISRETLQENRNLMKITSSVTKQLLTHLSRMAETSPDKYIEFWKIHGKIFKLGSNDFSSRDKYTPLLRFNSSHCDDAEGLVSLDEYIARAKPDQKQIFFVAGNSRQGISMSPYLDIFKKKGLEVLYLYDPIDEFALETLRNYKEFDFQPIEHVEPTSLQKFESTETTDETEPLSDDQRDRFDGLLERVKAILGERVQQVKVSERLTDSPCCLVSPDGAMTSSMQRILQIVSHDASIPPKNLEVNRDHPLWRNLLALYAKDTEDAYLESVVEQLFDSCLLAEGYLQDPHQMVERMQNLLNQSSGWYLTIKESNKV